MKKYFIKRLLWTIPTFIGITLVVFVITRFVPGGPIERALAAAQMKSMEGGGSSRSGNSGPLSEEQLNQLKEYYGFDKPVLVSYILWLKKIVTLDLGQSTRYGESVWGSIKERLPISCFYGIFGIFISYFLCIPLGVLKALKHKTIFDVITSLFVFTCYAIPGYVIGIGLLVILGSQLKILPMGGFKSDGFSDLGMIDQVWDIAQHAIMPLTAYAAGSLAVMTFLTKNSLLEQLSADYVRTAVAKGMSFRQAVIKHAFKNSLIPIATHFGNNISLVLAGSFLIEKIFNIDGMGLLGYESVVERDYPVVMGVLVVSSILQLFGNILSDACVALVDPRVTY